MRIGELSAALDPIPSTRPRTLRELARRIRWENGRQGFGPLGLGALERTLGANSMRAALAGLDAPHPPSGLAGAYSKIGYPVGAGTTVVPAVPISLRQIGNRLHSPETVQLRFLSYNTYLLQGLQIPLARWIDDAVGWDALSWFGVPAGGALLALVGVSSIPGMAVFSVLALAGWTPSKIIKKVTGINLDGIRIQPKPALETRASELGGAITGYDLCCLCEVWTTDSQRRLLAGLDQGNSTEWAHQAGPDDSGEWTLAGSGLFFLARNHRIVTTARAVYSDRGSRFRDSDAWSKKGMMLNVLDLGFGRLELFQTHLFYGGGIPIARDPTDADRLPVWRSELAQLANFIRENHDPENVSIVTGDFNISGADMRLYPEIRRALDPLGFHDIWAWDVFGHNPSQGLTCRFTDGEESAWDRTFNAVCEYRNQEGMRGAWREYCDDDVIHPTPQRGVGRYDYVFIERPMRAHKYTLEIVRPIRRSFPRREATDKEDYLSDHLGIDLTFLCTRK